MAAERAGQFADAARGRHAHLRQRQRDGDRRRQRPDRLWRQQAGRPARHLQSQDRTAGRQRRCRDRRQQRHARSIPTRSTSPTISPTASSMRCASRRSTRPISPPKAPSAAAGMLDDLPQRRLHGLRTLRGKAGQGADLAHQGAARSSGTARRRRFASRIRASSSSACRSPTSRSSRSPDPTVKRKTGFLIPGITYNSDLGVGVIVPFYFALVADLRSDAHRHATIRSRASSARPNGASASTMASTI